MIVDTIEINGSTRDTILNNHPKLYEQFDCCVQPLPGGSWIDKVQLHFVKSCGVYDMCASCTDPYEKDKFQYQISTAGEYPRNGTLVEKTRWNFKVLRLWFHLKAESLGEI